MTLDSNTSHSDRPRLLILGTGAGDWPKTVPPEEQTYTGNRDYRRFSAAVLNDHILIDCGPTLLNSLAVFEVNPRGLTDLLITHTHWDHLDMENLQGLLTLRQGLPPLQVWGHASGVGHLATVAGLELHTVEAGTTFNIAEWTIEPVRANHWVAETQEQALLYLFAAGELQWLYATDTAWLPTPTYWRVLETRLQLIVLDATYGDSLESPAQFGHNTLAMIRLILKSLRQDKALVPGGSVVLTHLSRGWHPAHAELEEKIRVDGMIPAYDGMKLTIGS